jgi:hypothetical protein
MAKSENAAVVEMLPLVVLVHVAPPSLDFQMPVLPGKPLTACAPTAT